MNDIIIGKGNLVRKGVFADRNFKKGEIVIKYNLKPLTKERHDSLPEDQKLFTHIHWDQIYLYGVPERYVNHSSEPNTHPDLQNKCDIAIRDIEKDEMITTNATMDDVY